MDSAWDRRRAKRVRRSAVSQAWRSSRVCATKTWEEGEWEGGGGGRGRSQGE